MALTLSSLLSMLIFNNLFIVFTYFILKNYKFILSIGVKLILFCLFLISFRFLLPFEFSFMRTIAIKKILPDFYTFITKRHISFFNVNFYLLDILYYIWIIGIIVILLKLLILYFLFEKRIKNYEIVTDKKIIDILNIINSNYRSKVNFRILYTNKPESPFIFRLRSPVIVIPRILLSYNDWFYVLSHEIAHYYHRDLFYKTFAELLSILYWWNPFIYLLKRQIATLLEINIDSSIIENFNYKQKLDYSECLLKIIHLCNNHKQTLYNATTFRSRKKSIISQRINIILAYAKGSKPILQVVTLISSILLTITTCSYCFIFEPCSIPNGDIGNTFEISDYDSYYMIENNNGTYSLYFNSKYLTTVYEIFDPNIKIY